MNDHFQEALDRADNLTPHDPNPLDTPPEYNPLKYCYQIIAKGANHHEYEISLRFLLQTWSEQTPIEFTNMRTGEKHSIPFFPVAPEVELEPDYEKENNGYEKENNGYQIGESTYWLVPAIDRVKRLADNQILDHDTAARIITPDALQTAILEFRDKIHEDPNAPEALIELLDVWDDIKTSATYDDNDDDRDWS
jgi:hypothetical protein